MTRTSGGWAALLVLVLGLDAAGQDIAENENRAIGALKTLNTAQALFREGDKDGNGELDYAADLQALAKPNLISKALASGSYHGYTFKVTRGKHPSFLWMATASPTTPGTTGERHFATSHEGVVYQSLQPFTHTPDCKLSGTPVGGKLPGHTPKKSKPEGPWGVAYRAAEGKLERRVRPLHLFSSDDKLRIISIRKRELQVVDLEPKSGQAQLTRTRWDDQGRLASLRIEKAKIGGRPELLLNAKRVGGELIVKAGGKERKVAWKPNTITPDMALYLLPRTQAHLPKNPADMKLSLGTAEGVHADPLKITTVAGEGAERTVTLEHPSLGGAVAVRVGDPGGSALVGFAGPGKLTWKLVSAQEARKIFLSRLKDKDALIRDLKRARKGGNEAAAIGSLKTISTAQALFREGDKDRNGDLDYAGDLMALGTTRLIDSVLASGTKQGYRFKLTRSKKNPEFRWMATAEPLKPGATGDRYFAINHAGRIFHAKQAFKHTPKCEIKGGVPVGQTLPGDTPAKIKPPTSPRAGEAAVIGLLKTISTCQSLFREGDKDQDGQLDYARNLDELIDAKLLNQGSVLRSGYSIKLCAGSKAPEFTWMAVASPTKPGVTGDRHFAMNHEGVIFYSDKPIKLDTIDCKIPSGINPVGR